MPQDDQVITRVEALRSLRIAPGLFRQVAEEYRSELGPLPLGGVTPQQLETMKEILRLRASGATKDEVQARLAVAAGSAVEAAVGGRGEVDEREALLKRLTDEFERAEEQRAEDRDRLLSALIRTQQEIAHLRQELASSKSRRDRKKGGFFSRFFG